MLLKPGAIGTACRQVSERIPTRRQMDVVKVALVFQNGGEEVVKIVCVFYVGGDVHWARRVALAATTALAFAFAATSALAFARRATDDALSRLPTQHTQLVFTRRRSSRSRLSA